jgi:hypothetical protein
VFAEAELARAYGLRPEGRVPDRRYCNKVCTLDSRDFLIVQDIRSQEAVISRS